MLELVYPVGIPLTLQSLRRWGNESGAYADYAAVVFISEEHVNSIDAALPNFIPRSLYTERMESAATKGEIGRCEIFRIAIR